jgi:hypothetical protein
MDDLSDDFDKIQTLILPCEPSTAQSLSMHLTKILILTCASYYEQQLQNAYTAYAQRQSDAFGDNPHGFDNDKRDKSVYQKFEFGKIENPEDQNQLPSIRRLLEPLKFFGEKFKEKVYNEVSNDAEKEKQLKAFQEIFAIRNLIAHQTFLEFNSAKIRGKSFKDIQKLHNDAIKFVEYLVDKFR